MFTPEDRASLRSDLVEFARRDARIAAGAVTGSAATDREDKWSDIDLAFGIIDTAELPSVLSDWTARMYQRHSAVHHFDVKAGAWIYRVFLLASTLQADLAFVPAREFRALAPTFRLLFGQANDPRHAPPQPTDDLIGMGLLYALHARSSMARGRVWQAELMISCLRDNALSLACIGHGLPSVHGRGFDQLPSAVIAQFEESLVRSLEPVQLARAFRAATQRFFGEIEHADPKLAKRLEPILASLIATS
jgi:hypothetical protein